MWRNHVSGPHQKGTSSGTMVCICMAANYLAAYYLQEQHTNEHTRIDTRIPAEGRWEAPSYRVATQGLGGVAWHWHRLGIGIGSA
jgi:hypothetical protein